MWIVCLLFILLILFVIHLIEEAGSTGYARGLKDGKKFECNKALSMCTYNDGYRNALLYCKDAIEAKDARINDLMEMYDELAKEKKKVEDQLREVLDKEIDLRPESEENIHKFIDSLKEKEDVVG